MILHVDLDAFFAAVEIRDQPALADKPVLVGHRGARSVVVAASYIARKFGCRSAMPMGQALRLCPQAIVVEPRRAAYTEASAKFFEILRRVSPLVEELSVDEAFIDVTGTERLFGAAPAVGQQIKADVKRELQLTATVGAAPVKFVAKIASDFAKPDGLLVIEAERVVSFLAPLPIDRLFGVGPKMGAQLRSLGLQTLGQLAAYDTDSLARKFGTHGPQLQALARGIDPRCVVADRQTKTISAEETFETDLHLGPAILKHVLSQAEHVAERLRKAALRGRTVVLKLKDPDFKIITRRKQLAAPTQDGGAIARVAEALLAAAPIGSRGVRLVGVGVTDLSEMDAPLQLTFGIDEAARAEKLQHTLDKIRNRFGHEAVARADLLDEES